MRIGKRRWIRMGIVASGIWVVIVLGRMWYEGTGWARGDDYWMQHDLDKWLSLLLIPVCGLWALGFAIAWVVNAGEPAAIRDSVPRGAAEETEPHKVHHTSAAQLTVVGRRAVRWVIRIFGTLAILMGYMILTGIGRELRLGGALFAALTGGFCAWLIFWVWHKTGTSNLGRASMGEVSDTTNPRRTEEPHCLYPVLRAREFEAEARLNSEPSNPADKTE